MADRDKLLKALRGAHEAGDEKAARRIAGMIKSLDAKREGADQSFWGRVKDNVVGVDDGIMSAGERLGTLLNMGGESLTLGVVGDEAAAAADTAIGRGGTYEENLDRYRSNEETVREENPVASFAADVAPALVAPAAGVMSGASLAGRVGLGALAGGAAGGTYGFMEGEGSAQERARNARLPAALGAAGGVAAPLIGAGVGKVANNRANRRALRELAEVAPDEEGVRRQATNLFNSRDAALSRPAFREAVEETTEQAQGMGMRPRVTPTAQGAADDILADASKASDAISINELDSARNVAQMAAGNITNPREAAIGTKFVSAIDDFVDQASERLGAKGKEARRLWGVMRKMGDIDEIFERASVNARGLENGLRVEFRKILRNPKLRKKWSKTELDAMREVLNSESILGRIVRNVGNLGLNFSGGSNAMGAAASAGLGGAAGGIPGAVGSLAATTAARSADAARTQAAARRVADIVRLGGRVNLPDMVTPQARGLLDETVFSGLYGLNVANQNR